MNTSPNNVAFLMAQALQPGYEEDLFAGEAALAAAVGLNSADETLPYSTAELNAPEYSTDDFRMFSFKVARCSKRYVHDWRACPFAHPTENARRRDPRLHKYLPVPCPEYKRGICFRGDACPYSHGVYECWLHPAKYRTQLCKEGPHCRRPVCFFAHSVLDLRQPTHVWDGNNFEPPQAAAPAAAPASRSNSDNAFLLQQQQAAVEEALNNNGSEGMGNNNNNGGNDSGSGGAGPSSPHGSNGQGRSISPQSAPTWSPSAAAMLAEAASRDTSPITPSRASCDLPARPSAEPSAAAVLAAAGTPPGNGMTVASALAAALAQAQAQQAQAAVPVPSRPGLPPRHSIDVGALAASSSRGSLTSAGSAGSLPLPPPQMGQPSSSVQQQQQQLPGARMSFDVGSSAQSAPAPLGPRMSLDSLMTGRQAGGAWAPAPTPGLDSTGANGPRMSNAVARKLGLAPQRTANEARMAKLRTGGGGVATPPRTSLDGLLQALHGSHRASLEQQMVNQQMLAAGLAHLNGGVMNGGYMASAFPQPAYGADPSMGINPALLSVVAAQMGGAVPAPMQAPGQPNAAAMAALVDSLQGWSINQAGGGAVQPGFPGGPMPHRATSFDSAMSQHAAAAHMLAQQGPPTSSPYYLPSELETMMNNHSGDGLVNPVAAGPGGRVSRE